MREKYCLSVEKRLDLFGLQLQAIVRELEDRDLKDVPTDKLLQHQIKYAQLIKDESRQPGFMDDIEIQHQKGISDMLDSIKLRT